MSRRNRTNRRHAYGKRQHDVRERRPSGAPSDDFSGRDDGWTPDALDDTRRRDDGFDGYEGFVR